MLQLPPVPDPFPGSFAPFRCSLTLTPGPTCVNAAGELDLSTATELRQLLELAQSHARLIVLDTREVSFIDSSGLHVILNANAANARGAPRLAFVPGPVVDRLLRMVGAEGDVWTVDLAPTDAPGLDLVADTHA